MFNAPDRLPDAAEGLHGQIPTEIAAIDPPVASFALDEMFGFLSGSVPIRMPMIFPRGISSFTDPS
jgi:hypothetical protein